MRTPRAERDALQATHELARVDDRVMTRRPPQAADDDGGVDLRPCLGRGEDLGRLAVIGGDPRPLVEAVGLPGCGREGQAAGLLEVAVDALPADEGDQLVVVARALGLEDVDLVGEVAQAVGQAVGQAGLDDAAVPPAGAVAHDLLLEQHDVRRWRRVLELDGRPEAAEAAADDDHVGLALALEGWFGWVGRAVEPEGRVGPEQR